MWITKFKYYGSICYYYSTVWYWPVSNWCRPGTGAGCQSRELQLDKLSCHPNLRLVEYLGQPLKKIKATLYSTNTMQWLPYYTVAVYCNKKLCSNDTVTQTKRKVIKTQSILKLSCKSTTEAGSCTFLHITKLWKWYHPICPEVSQKCRTFIWKEL